MKCRCTVGWWWSYPTGAGTWNGVFYPPRARRGRSKFDELAYYAQHFDSVEVNSSFYRTPEPHVTRSWVRRTPADFTFSLKLYQRFTHPRMFAESTGSHTPVGQDDVDVFRSAVHPIAESGKLGPLLAQFPPSFKNDGRSCDYLDWLLGAFEAYPVAVELRHRTWSDDTQGTLDLLNRHGAAWVQIDEPKFTSSDPSRPSTEREGLLLHAAARPQRGGMVGARARGTAVRLSVLDRRTHPIAEAVRTARRGVGQVYLYLNNHFSAKAVANAVQLQQALDVPVRGTYPASFVARYPQIGELVSTETLPLLLP